MPRRFWWLPLLLVAILLAVWLLVDRPDAPAASRERTGGVESIPQVPKIAPYILPEASGPAEATEVSEAHQPHASVAAARRSRKPLPVWAPLPVQPAGALRPVRGSDTGSPDDEELEPVRLSLPTRRFRVTLQGRVEAQPQFLEGMRVWADTLPGLASGQEKMAGDLGAAGSGRLWPDGEPRGSALVDQAGTFEVSVEVTGVDRKALLEAAGQSSEGVETGDYIARLLLRIEAENTWSLGQPVLPLRAGQEVAGIVVETFARPIAQYRFEFPDGTAAAHAAVTLLPMLERDGRRIALGAFGWTDRHGRMVAPLTGATSSGFHVNGSRGHGGLIVTSMERDWDELQVIRAGDPRSHSVIRMSFRGEGAEPDAPPLLVEVHDQRLLRLSGRPAPATGDHTMVLSRGVASPLRLESRGWGAVVLELPEVPAGMCLVLDPVVFPSPRVARIQVMDARGLPLAGVTVQGRALTQDGRDVFEHLPDGVTDEFGEIDLPVLPDRDYRMRCTRRGESQAHTHSMRFMDAGPHVIQLPDP